ncbi:MAG TPA: helix-turn-helix transcriptional regulator [Pyrinomonadaceae bacterium]|nr:helix-turn-helix transcriptional regulator [Pyrinomonadaceae bacterium]
MGRAHRSRPNRLGEKLLLIRTQLGLTQSQLIDKLAVKGEALYPSSISLFEQSGREPSLLVLLAYSNLAGVTINQLVDDQVRLSELSIKRRR